MGINFDDIEFEDIVVRAEGDGDAVRGGSEGEGDVVRGRVEGEGDAIKGGVEGEGDVEEFDDSSDSDYVHPIESDDSNAPSLVFEDIEDSKNTNLKNVELVVRLTFENAQQYMEVLRDWCVWHGYDIEWLKNENHRITVKCKHDGCDWRVHASPIMGGPTFQIKIIKGQHTCARTYDNSLAKTSYLAKRMENEIRDNPNIPIQQIRKCNVEINRFKVLKAKKTPLEAIRGADSKQYEYLWNYCETVRQHNPNSKLILRKVNCWFVVGRDDNDNMVPIALVVVSVENRETWTWFVGELLEDLKVSDDVETASEWLKGFFSALGKVFFPKFTGYGNPEEVATQGSQAAPHSQHDAREEANMNQPQPSPAVQKQPSHLWLESRKRKVPVTTTLRGDKKGGGSKGSEE
ncbi:UNVERIFIED_CONTAM: hypothetical protein Scaly_2534200 [Sesamum calycinum]|uniref:Transposase MuDR plant domain-containing protein n=1 Tax=Sesamum calycinum TaxID=2727403 RepID=A0AAW2LUG6_9LAMI